MGSFDKKLKAFVRIDGQGRVVAGSLILRRKQPKIGKWMEVRNQLCCNTTTTTTTAIPYSCVFYNIDVLRGEYEISWINCDGAELTYTRTAPANMQICAQRNSIEVIGGSTPDVVITEISECINPDYTIYTFLDYCVDGAPSGDTVGIATDLPYGLPTGQQLYDGIENYFIVTSQIRSDVNVWDYDIINGLNVIPDTTGCPTTTTTTTCVPEGDLIQYAAASITSNPSGLITWNTNPTQEDACHVLELITENPEGWTINWEAFTNGTVDGLVYRKSTCELANGYFIYLDGESYAISQITDGEGNNIVCSTTTTSTTTTP